MSKEDRFFKFLNFSQFPEIIHGISNRSYGDMRFGRLKEEEIIRNRKIFLNDLGVNISSIVAPEIVHSAKINLVGKKEKGKGSLNRRSAVPKTDGLLTQEKQIYLMATAADCLPILIYDPILRTVCIVHAGWRGIINQIIPRTIDSLKDLGTDPQNLIVGIGPSICQKHFVVRKDVLKKFMVYYPSASFVRNKHGYVDLKKTALIDFKKAGIPQDNIEVAKFCTYCDNGMFGSFRKEKEDVPASMAVIGMRG